MRKNIVPMLGLAIAGIGLAALFAFMHRSGAPMHGSTPAQTARPSIAPAQSPYPTFVAGAGIVEASTENIAIGTPIAGLVSKINVQVGSRVKKGDPLFSIDSRATRAELTVRQAAVQVAEAQLANAKNQFTRVENIANSRAVSVEERDKRRYAVQIAEAQLAQATANVQSTETDLERMTIRAPVDGQVLQLKVRPGEFAATGVLPQPLTLLGSVDRMNVRVDVDENDAWRVKAGTPAVAFLRGNKDIKTPLKFVRFEPYVVPKRSLTGDSTERVDTRVLQAIYSFDRGDLPIYVGQQMNVFIEAPGHNERASLSLQKNQSHS
jgi:HlyD family secretion protein